MTTKEDFKGILKQIATMSRQIATILNKLSSIDARFDMVDKRFDMVDKKFDVIDMKFAIRDSIAENLHYRVKSKPTRNSMMNETHTQQNISNYLRNKYPSSCTSLGSGINIKGITDLDSCFVCLDTIYIVENKTSITKYMIDKKIKQMPNLKKSPEFIQLYQNKIQLHPSRSSDTVTIRLVFAYKYASPFVTEYLDKICSNTLTKKIYNTLTIKMFSEDDVLFKAMKRISVLLKQYNTIFDRSNIDYKKMLIFFTYFKRVSKTDIFFVVVKRFEKYKIKDDTIKNIFNTEKIKKIMKEDVQAGKFFKEMKKDMVDIIRQIQNYIMPFDDIHSYIIDMRENIDVFRDGILQYTGDFSVR